MTRVAVNGVSLAIHEWPGKGRALVGVHGLTANHTCWASMADILSPDYRLIAYDLRGAGTATNPRRGTASRCTARTCAACSTGTG